MGKNNFPAKSKLPEKEIQKATRHLFLCTGPDCCDAKEHEYLWKLLKEESRKLKVPVLRTKAACVRICKAGPWLVVYPDGIWYGEVDKKRLLRILKEHVEQNTPIQEWIATDMPALQKAD
ncbi:MAG: (2Fe-2S) ferredoxin domain-containing protein [Chthoniobacterales bacterium]